MASNTIEMTVTVADVNEVRGVLEAAANLVNYMPPSGDTWEERAATLAQYEGPVWVSAPGLAAVFHAIAQFTAHRAHDTAHGATCWCQPTVASVPPARDGQ